MVDFPSRRPSPDPALLLLDVLGDVGDRPAGEQRDERAADQEHRQALCEGLRLYNGEDGPNMTTNTTPRTPTKISTVAQSRSAP